MNNERALVGVCVVASGNLYCWYADRAIAIEWPMKIRVPCARVVAAAKSLAARKVKAAREAAKRSASDQREKTLLDQIQQVC